MRYQYRMVQLAPIVTIEHGKQKGNEAALYLQNIVDDHAKQGWEFYRIDTIGVAEKPGCLAGLFGAKATAIEYYVATFRAPVPEK